MIPNDPVMLVSYMNLKLRDFYHDLESLCEDMQISEAEIRKKLEAIDYHYDEERNQFN